MHHETVGVPIGKRLEENAVGDAEDRGVRGDAERDREQDDERVSRGVAQRADRVPDVADEILEVRAAAGLVPLLFEALDAAEGGEGSAPGLIARDAALFQLGGFHVDVEAHLVVDLALVPPAAEEVEDAHVASSTASMALAKARQLARSSAPWVRPFAVSE